MRVLMLGWEFPPYITGGLGTACFGLTKAMNRRGMQVTFVLPKADNGSESRHVRIVGPENTPLPPDISAAILDPKTGSLPGMKITTATGSDELSSTEFIGIDAGFAQPYQTQPGTHVVGETQLTHVSLGTPEGKAPPKPTASQDPVATPQQPEDEHTEMPVASIGQEYGGDMITLVERYARFCLAATQGKEFDIIHAHDWMTYPAGMLVARHTGKPLVVHVHSTEFDRSGVNVNQRIYDIERRGMHAARRVVTVSAWTKNICLNRYGVPDDHIEVIYNGVDFEPTQSNLAKGIRRKDKIVLYFGRITMQKGPEYFVAAAKRVLDVMKNVKFVVAGSGDMARHMIEMAANMGIGHKILFTGFLRGDDINRVFSLADLYVMPSVSEPFGIAPLEAMTHDVPVLISKSSGVSEVLSHALKVDFWDIEDMANKIVAVLRHPPLSQTLQKHGSFEVRKITWDGAAERCERLYNEAIEEMTAPVLMHH